jgi:sugar phosphate isomerase/epimerase
LHNIRIITWLCRFVKNFGGKFLFFALFGYSAAVLTTIRKHDPKGGWPMQLTFSTLSCPAWTLDQILHAAEGNGYAGVEIRGLQEHVDLRQSPTFQPANRAAVRRQFADAGIAITCLGASARFADSRHRDASVIEAREYVEMAAELRCPMVRVFGGSPGPEDSDDGVQRVADSLTELAPFAAAHNVTLVLETHDAFVTGERAAAVLSRVNHPAVGVVWDVCNAFLTGEAVQTAYAALAPYVKHVHVKDAIGEHPCLLGKGDVPIREVVLRLKADEGALPPLALSVEWEKRWMPDIAEPEVVLPQYAAKLRAYLAETPG